MQIYDEVRSVILRLQIRVATSRARIFCARGLVASLSRSINSDDDTDGCSDGRSRTYHTHAKTRPSGGMAIHKRAGCQPSRCVSNTMTGGASAAPSWHPVI